MTWRDELKPLVWVKQSETQYLAYTVAGVFQAYSPMKGIWKVWFDGNMYSAGPQLTAAQSCAWELYCERLATAFHNEGEVSDDNMGRTREAYR